MNQLKTVMLLAALTALFMVVGFAIGGRAGAMLALVVAAGMNLFTFWNADKIVLKMHDAREVDERTAPEFVAMIRELAGRAKLPMPRVYIVESPHPNAFATGRNPQNAAVAATRGLLELLSPREVRGVMAHELAHVRNRDTLVMTMVATIAGAISMIANFGLFFRSGDNRGSMVAGLLAVLVAPFAAMIVQMAISRTREYGADAGGAEISGDPAALASALDKLASGAARTPNHYAERNPAAAQLYIVPTGMKDLFSTHPDTGKRVAALRAMAANIDAVDFDPPSLSARRGTASVPSSRRRASALDPNARRD